MNKKKLYGQMQTRRVKIFHWKKKRSLVFSFCIIYQCPTGILSVDKEVIKIINLSYCIITYTCTLFSLQCYCGYYAHFLKGIRLCWMCHTISVASIGRQDYFKCIDFRRYKLTTKLTTLNLNENEIVHISYLIFFNIKN